MEKPTKTFGLFRLSGTPLSKPIQRAYSVPPYLCERLSKKAVIFYAELTMRVKISDLGKHIIGLSDCDAKVLQKAERDNKTWQAHCIGRRHKLLKPIESKKGHEHFKYLEPNDPIIVKLLSENNQAKKYKQECKDINWVLITIKPSLAKAILHCKKQWEFRKGITRLSLETNEREIRKAVYNPFKWGVQPIIITGKKQEKDAKRILAHIYHIVKELHDYISTKAAEDRKNRYNPLRDSFVIYILDHLKQFNISQDQAFSSIPLKIKWKTYKNPDFAKIHRKSWTQLSDNFSYGTAESMS